jgi:hypothetical protein
MIYEYISHMSVATLYIPNTPAGRHNFYFGKNIYVEEDINVNDTIYSKNIILLHNEIDALKKQVEILTKQQIEPINSRANVQMKK